MNARARGYVVWRFHSELGWIAVYANVASIGEAQERERGLQDLGYVTRITNDVQTSPLPDSGATKPVPARERGTFAEATTCR